MVMLVCPECGNEVEPPDEKWMEGKKLVDKKTTSMGGDPVLLDAFSETIIRWLQARPQYKMPLSKDGRDLIVRTLSIMASIIGKDDDIPRI
jgi:hypothetical protein